MKYIKYLFYLVIALIIFIAGAAVKSKQAVQYLNQIRQLKDGWAETTAQLISQKDMNKDLEATAKTLSKSNRKLAQDKASLEIELAELKGQGPAVIETRGGMPWVARYEDDKVQLEYDLETYLFNYTLKPRPISLTVIGKRDNTWDAIAYDPATDKDIPIRSLNVLSVPRNDKWYKKIKLGLAAGYDEGLIAGVKISYGKGHAIPWARLKSDGLVYGGAFAFDLW